MTLTDPAARRSFAPPHSGGGAGIVRKLITVVPANVVLVALPAIVGPAFLAVLAGTPFGNGAALSFGEMAIAFVGFLLGVAVTLGLMWLNAKRRARR